MSDDISSTDKSLDNMGSASSSATQSESGDLLEQLKVEKGRFDALLEAATRSIEAGVETARLAAGVVASAETEIANAKTAADISRSATEQAAARAKTSLSEIETFKLEIATIKGAIEAIQNSAVGDAAAVTNSKLEIEKQKSAAEALLSQLSQDHKDIATSISELQVQQTALQGILKGLSDAKLEVENDSVAAKVSLREIGAAKDAFVNLNTDTQAHYDELVQRQNALQAKIVEIETANDQIGILRRALLDGYDGTKSVQDQISELRSQIDEILADVSKHKNVAVAEFEAFKAKYETEALTWNSELNTKFDKLHESLQEKILALLPSAGAAGLSSTYYDAKSRYAPTSFAGNPGTMSANGSFGRLRSYFGYNPASVVATIAFYVMFIAPLAVIAIGSFQLLQKMENQQFQVDYKMLAVRFLIAVPLATLSTFGFASLRLYRKLFEEYNHKQRVMELYQSFKHEVDTVGSDEQKKALLTIMLNSAASKAWEDAEGVTQPQGLNSLSTLEKLTGDISKLKAIFG